MFEDGAVDDFLHKSRVMVFRPTLDEFRDFTKYVEYMEERGAAQWGIAKIIPPEGWKACEDLKSKIRDSNISIPHPIQQEITSTHAGIYQQLNIEQPELSLEEYETLAMSGKFSRPKGTIEFVEQRYWRGLTFNPPIYGADVEGSLYDETVEEWNIPRLGDILERVCDKLNVRIPGVNSPYLYFGMWKTTFPWHVEDMDLYSINYLHYGEPKFWYAIPQIHADRFESMVRGVYPDFFKVCPEFMRHKMTIVSPKNLSTNGIPINRMIQREGEFMITFPRGYHSGFNMGYNAAESVNFALHRWVNMAKKSKFCVCFGDTVSINMDNFIDGYNELYDKNITKSVRRATKQHDQPSQRSDILSKMRPRRRLTDQKKRSLSTYKSRGNKNAIRLWRKYRVKMGKNGRKWKRVWCGGLLRRSRKRAYKRNLHIDPPEELKYEVILESDSEETPRTPAIPSTHSSIKIAANDVSSSVSSFPRRSWYDHALQRIEKDFTLRAENVKLRSESKRRKSNMKRISSVGSTVNRSDDKLMNVSPGIIKSDAKVETIRSPRNVVTTPQLVADFDHMFNSMSRKRKKISAPATRNKDLEIDLDLPSSFLGNKSASDPLPSKEMEEIISSMDLNKDEVKVPKENKRKTRANKGGRPIECELKRFPPKVQSFTSVFWEPAETFDMPSTLIYGRNQNTIENTAEDDPVYNQFNTDHVEDVVTDKSSWQLCLLKEKGKGEAGGRGRGKPSFDSTGPALNQKKINAITQESSPSEPLPSAVKFHVDLKDLVLFKRNSEVAVNNSNRSDRGRIVCLKSDNTLRSSMEKLIWIFDHTYSIADTSSGPDNILAVRGSKGKYNVVFVDKTCGTTVTQDGAVFVQSEARWRKELLSQGHNIMAILNSQSVLEMNISQEIYSADIDSEIRVTGTVSQENCSKMLKHMKMCKKRNKKTELGRSRALKKLLKQLDTCKQPIHHKSEKRQIKGGSVKNLDNYAWKAEMAKGQYSDSTFCRNLLNSVQMPTYLPVPPSYPIPKRSSSLSGQQYLVNDAFSFPEEPSETTPSTSRNAGVPVPRLGQESCEFYPKHECNEDVKPDVRNGNVDVFLDNGVWKMSQSTQSTAANVKKESHHDIPRMKREPLEYPHSAGSSSVGGSVTHETRPEGDLVPGSIRPDMSRDSTTQINSDLEQRIQWCIENRNADPFRVWGPSINVDVVPPPLTEQTKPLECAAFQRKRCLMTRPPSSSSICPDVEGSHEISRKETDRRLRQSLLQGRTVTEQQILNSIQNCTQHTTRPQIRENMTLYPVPTRTPNQLSTIRIQPRLQSVLHHQHITSTEHTPSSVSQPCAVPFQYNPLSSAHNFSTQSQYRTSQTLGHASMKRLEGSSGSLPYRYRMEVPRMLPNPDSDEFRRYRELEAIRKQSWGTIGTSKRDYGR